MTPLFTPYEFDNAKYRDLLPLQCKVCEGTFFRIKKYILNYLDPEREETGDFCSKKCLSKGYTRIRATCYCKQCGKEFQRAAKRLKENKNYFCNRSCSRSFQNIHKKVGVRRSKLEFWIQKQLNNIYPHLNILYCDRTTINSELDIYIPSLKLAFELNGIFHYEPIFGQKYLNHTLSNDKRKFQACLEKGIELCIIDTSHQKYFKESSSKEFLDIICQIISNKLVETPVHYDELLNMNHFLHFQI